MEQYRLQSRTLLHHSDRWQRSQRFKDGPSPPHLIQVQIDLPRGRVWQAHDDELLHCSRIQCSSEPGHKAAPVMCHQHTAASCQGHLHLKTWALAQYALQFCFVAATHHVIQRLERCVPWRSKHLLDYLDISAVSQDVREMRAHSLWPRALMTSATSAVSSDRSYALRSFGLSDSPYPRMSMATTCRPEISPLPHSLTIVGLPKLELTLADWPQLQDGISQHTRLQCQQSGLAHP